MMTESDSRTRSAPWLWGLALLAATAAAAGIIARLDLGWGGALAVMLLAISFIVPLMLATERRARATGSLSPAMRSYNRRMVASSFFYTIMLFVAVASYKEWRPEGIAAWLIGLLPSIGVMAMIWSMASLLREESDEYLRLKIVQSSLVAGGFLLVVATIWGFFEQFRLVPHVPSWAAVPIFGLGLGLANGLRWLRS